MIKFLIPFPDDPSGFSKPTNLNVTALSLFGTLGVESTQPVCFTFDAGTILGSDLCEEHLILGTSTVHPVNRIRNFYFGDQ